jgi:phosphoglucosamine mutase
LQAALIDGLMSAGADVALLGVVPTPAVARAVADGLPDLAQRPVFGVVVSASHNPAADNGIKLFGPSGEKLSDDVEGAIERRLVEAPGSSEPVPTPGVVRVDLSDQPDWYVDAVVATVPRSLDGLRVVVDCANGAAGTVAADAYRRAGADAVVLNAERRGEHINEGCGATHPEAVVAAVLEHRADVGISHDGDADRCVAVAADGSLVDGDAILAILAFDMQRRGALRGDAIAATVMSNLGLERALRAQGIGLVRTPVGDRYVAERMRAEGLGLGGEQSGHVVLLDHATTGDGILTALHLLSAVVGSGRPLAELAAGVERLPQVLVNVPVTDSGRALTASGPLVDEAAAALGEDGRVLVRASGTEPVVRVMVEATDAAAAEHWAQHIAAAMNAS